MTADTTDFVAARSAEPDDVPDLVTIATEHAEQIVEQRGAQMLLRRELPYTRSALVAALTQASEAADQVLIVGTIDQVIVGFAHVVLEQLVDGGQLARLEQLLVEPQARAVGVGEAMMNLVIAESRRRGCFGIDSRALPGDRNTKNFFESYGMKARQLVVHLPLIDD